MTQASNLCRLSLIGLNTGKDISVTNLGLSIIEGTLINMETNLIIVSVVFTIHVIIVAYIWPLRIAVDPDRPLKWYYPCVCGCFRG